MFAFTTDFHSTLWRAQIENDRHEVPTAGHDVRHWLDIYSRRWLLWSNSPLLVEFLLGLFFKQEDGPVPWRIKIKCLKIERLIFYFPLHIYILYMYLRCFWVFFFNDVTLLDVALNLSYDNKHLFDDKISTYNWILVN